MKHFNHVVTASLPSGRVAAAWEGAAASPEDATARAMAALGVTRAIRTDGRPMELSLGRPQLTLAKSTNAPTALAAGVQVLTLKAPLLRSGEGPSVTLDEVHAAADALLRIMAPALCQRDDRTLAVNLGPVSLMHDGTDPHERQRVAAQAIGPDRNRTLPTTEAQSLAMLTLTLPRSAASSERRWRLLELPQGATLRAAFAHDLASTRQRDLATVTGHLGRFGLDDLASEIARDGQGAQP